MAKTDSPDTSDTTDVRAKGKGATAAPAPLAEKTIPSHQTNSERKAWLQAEADAVGPDVPEPVGYPKWKYSKDGDAVVVHSPEEEAKVAKGWADTPEDHYPATATKSKGKET